jgi:hypothetical protein
VCGRDVLSGIDRVAGGRQDPFVLVFATPAFCQSAICGPMLDTVKKVAADYPTLTFINVEPYKMAFIGGSLQPEQADGEHPGRHLDGRLGLLTGPCSMRSRRRRGRRPGSS